jgi:hypothetical protein
LDTYSGAAAAYSLRRLITTYTGSAIRVRRSSDNTEQNIGFDTNGDLDTVALSAFVGSGNGFVTTWYDQSGNDQNAVQITAANQPFIVNSGSLYTLNGKAIIRNPNPNVIRCLITPTSSMRPRPVSIIASGKLYELPTNGFGNVSWYLGGQVAAGGGGVYEFAVAPSSFNVMRRGGSFAIVNNGTNIYSPFIQQGHFGSTTLTNRFNGVDATTAITDTTLSASNFVLIGANSNQTDFMANIGMYEYIFYFTDKVNDRVAIESNINSYYSVYPNPTSVWNLLAAAYNADTKSLPSLKTSLVVAYNGESNTNDSFGTNNGTAVGGLTYGAGKIGNAFNFNGSNSYVALTVNTFKPTNTDFSISAWVNFSGTSANIQTIFSSISAIGGKSYGVIIYYYNNRLDCQISNASVNDLTSYNTTSLFNTWNLITFTRKAGNSSKLYINGTLVASNSLTNNPTYPNNTVPSIGAADYNGTHTNQYFCANGTKIDSVGIWNKELTASEVSELYNSGNGAQYIGDNFYKPTTNDALNTNNGTAQGGLTYAPGKIGTAFQFNGTNAYVSFTPGSFNSLTTDFSISAWVYLPGGYNANNCPIFSNMSAPGWFETPGGFWLRFAGTTIQLGISGKLNPTWLGYNISNDNLLGTWIHVVAVRKNSTSSKIYINNVLKASNTDTVNPVYYTGVNLTIPTIGNVKMPNGVQDSYYAYDGSKIDAVGIWNKSLTESEITELYNSGNGKQYPN